MQITMGSEDTFNGMLFGAPHPDTINFLKSQPAFNTASLLPAAGNFAQAVRTFSENFNLDRLTRVMEAASRTVAHMWDTNTIRLLDTISDFQQAPTVMIPYLMACPEVRKMYNAQQLDGWSHWFQDTNPGTMGEEMPEYRAVMQGIGQEVGDELHYVTYCEDTDHELDLSIGQQQEVLLSWDSIRYHLLNGTSDPTSRSNNAL